MRTLTTRPYTTMWAYCTRTERQCVCMQVGQLRGGKPASTVDGAITGGMGGAVVVVQMGYLSCSFV